MCAIVRASARLAATVGVAIAAGCAAGARPERSAPAETNAFAESPRGAILFIADDLGMDLLGTCGEPGLRTPHLDRLAAWGTQFPMAFASASSCSPSRAALLTGIPSHANGQYGIAHGTSHFAQFDHVATLPLVLQRDGCVIGWIGKRHVAPASSYPVDWSWDGDARDVTAMSAAAREFFRTARGKPFLLIVGFADPHRNFGSETEYAGDRSRPYPPDEITVPRILPDRSGVREEIARYWRSITRLDQGVGLLVGALQESGREDDTLIVFTSDNGAPFPGAKSNLTDPGIRMPFIVRSPMQIRRGVVCDAMVSHTDVLPTVLEWMRRAALRPSGVRERNLLAIMEQERPPEWDVVYASQSFHEVTMYYPMRAVRTRTHALILNMASALRFPIAEDVYLSTTWWGIVHHADPRLGDRPLESYLHRPRIELYDVVADPEQRVNLADHPKREQLRRGLEEQLRDWQDKTDDPWMVKYSHE